MTGSIAASSNFNGTAFWETEKSRVESTPFNLNILSTINNFSYNGKLFNITEISYEVPNWVGASPSTFTINATLYTPANESGTLGLMPGIVNFHGAGGKRQDMHLTSMDIASLDCVVLAPDQPGCGDSGGPTPNPDNHFHTGEFNETSYLYLVICGGLQSIRVLESFNLIVDNSSLGVTGPSLGGLTTMWVSSIYAENITVALPYVATGAWDTMFDSPESSIYAFFDTTPEGLQANYPHEADPVNYVNNPDLPDICWMLGTHDEIFLIDSINATFNNVSQSSTNKWLQITPNAHHDASFNNIDTLLFFVNYSFFGGPAPPQISFLSGEKVNTIVGDQYNIQFSINSAANIEYVEICYHYNDLIGDPWRSKRIYETSTGSGIWEGIIDPAWINSEMDFYLLVHLDTGADVYFTSQVFTAGTLVNNWAVLSIIGIVAAIGIPIFLSLTSRYKNGVRNVQEEKKKLARNFFVLETSLLGASEVLIFSSIFLPWFEYSRTVSWSQVYIMNAYFTYTSMLGDIAYYFTTLLFVLWILFGIVAFMKPMLGGFLNIIWPFFYIGITVVLAQGLFIAYDFSKIQIGMYVYLFAGVGQIIIGAWKVKMYKDFQIRKKKFGMVKDLLNFMKKRTIKESEI
ncbi:MAG: prolyl oligopeptidase family serine peptidase [Candidatus Hodarchaeota archaeon]